MSRCTIFAWNVSRESNTLAQSASGACKEPWCSGGAAEVSFEFGGGSLEAFNGVSKVLAVRAGKVMRVE